MQTFRLAWNLMKVINQFLPVAFVNGIECGLHGTLVVRNATRNLRVKRGPVIILIRSWLVDRNANHTLIFPRRAITHFMNWLTQNSNRRIAAFAC